MKTYRIGVIGRTGQGDYGHGIDTCWLEVPQAEIVAVADDDPAGRARAAARLKVKQTFADYRQMLDEVKPDVVSICQRWIDRHHEMAVACARRGIHMYMEKPFCRTLAEADEIVAECEKTHTRLALAHQTHYSPKLPVVKQLIAEGKLGRVLEFRGRGKEDTRGGGEDLWVLGSHIMELILELGGQPSWCFGAVTQAGKPITKADVVEGREGIGPLAGDAVRAVYGLSDGATAYFNSVRGAGSKVSRFGLQILGTGGVIEISTGYLPSCKFLPEGGWTTSRSAAKWLDISSAGLDTAEPLPNVGNGPGNVAAVKDLLRSIEEQREPSCGMYRARAATEMIVAVFESARLGAAVPLPLATRVNPLAKLG